MKKISIILVALSLAFTGCASSTNELKKDNASKAENVSSEVTKREDSDENVDETPEFEYETIGEIIEFGDGKVAILTGDIASDYDIDNSILENFYLGETVGVKKVDDKFILESYIFEDFDVRVTNMGQIIQEITGVVKSVDESNLTVTLDDKEMKFKINNPVFANEGDEITVAYLKMGDETLLLDVYNKTNSILVEVKNIKRDSETGQMVLECASKDEIDYIARISNSVKNFNMSELKPGDNVNLYFEVMAMSYPAQIAPKKVDLVKELQ